MTPTAKRTSLWIVCLAARTVHAATYYVSPQGMDGKPGTMPDAAWKTLDKVHETRLLPGDTVRFQRGGAWHGQLLATTDGTAAAPITFADYGDPHQPAPTFYGSDEIRPPLTRLSAGPGLDGTVYSFPTSAAPTGHVYWVYVDHKPLLAATAGGRGLPAGAFFVQGDTVYVNTGSVLPPGTTLGVGDRATGQSFDQGVICSSGHSHLVFQNLIGRETAQVPDGGKLADGIIDAYVIRVQGGRDVRLDHCEAYFGGKHNVGATDTYDFVADSVRASGTVNGVAGNTLGYGHATAFVSYADASMHGCVHTWTNCNVVDYPSDQPAFITHNDGGDSFKSLTLVNFHSAGSPVALMPGPNVAITFRGGLFENTSFSAYTSPGVTEMFDGIRFRGPGAALIVAGHATVQNCVVTGSTQDGGIQVSGPANVVRFNTVVMDPTGGAAVHLRKDATAATLLGNIFAGHPRGLSIDGAAATVRADYDVFDATSGTPQVIVDGQSVALAAGGTGGLEVHGVSGALAFRKPTAGDYTPAAGSPAIGRVPAALAAEVHTDVNGIARPARAAGDAGAFVAKER